MEIQTKQSTAATTTWPGFHLPHLEWQLPLFVPFKVLGFHRNRVSKLSHIINIKTSLVWIEDKAENTDMNW